jgi:hypothetical protein
VYAIGVMRVYVLLMTAFSVMKAPEVEGDPLIQGDASTKCLLAAVVLAKDELVVWTSAVWSGALVQGQLIPGRCPIQ